MNEDTGGGDDLMITLETDAGNAIEDVAELQNEVKDLNAELEYAIDLLDELENHEASGSLRVDTDDRLRFLEKRILHGDYHANENDKNRDRDGDRNSDRESTDAHDGGAAPSPPADFDGSPGN